MTNSTLIPALDTKRLSCQREAVLDVMMTYSHGYLTLAEISQLVHDRHGVHAPEASVSSRLRDFRKAEYGSYIVHRRRRGDPKNGLHEYRVTPSVPRQLSVFT